MGNLAVGDLAPGFEAELASGEKFRLKDFRGMKSVILFFYPKDFSPGCTKEACRFQDYSEEIARLDGAVFGVSLDSQESHRRFSGRHHLGFPLIADQDRKISERFGALRLGGRLLLRRITFVIDKQGRIARIIHSETNMNKHVDSAIEALKELAGSAATAGGTNGAKS